MIDSEIAGNENAGGDIQEEIQLEEPVIEEQPTAEAVAVAEDVYKRQPILLA